ncbi:MAG: ATP-binding protein [Verrucomicrobiota bacterium]
MNSMPKIRQLMFELALFCLVLVVGFVALQFYRLGPQIEDERRKMNDSREQFKIARNALKEAQDSVSQLDPSRNFFKVQDASKIQNEYKLLADLIESKTRDLQKTLIDLASQKLALEPGDAKSQDLKQRLLDWKTAWDAQESHIANDKVVQRSHNLKLLVEREASSGNTNIVLISMDIGSHLEQTGVLSNELLQELESFRKNTASRMTRRSIQTQVESADKKFTPLLNLANKLRADAAAIESFLKFNSSVEIDKQAQIIAKAIESRLPNPPLPSERLNFQKLFYALIVGLVGLSILFFVSCYRRFVLMPVHKQLAERDKIIQQQNMLTHFGRLAAEFAHEIRNPLTAINARLYTLQKSISLDTPEHNDAEIIGNEISRLDQIVKDFLKLARPPEPKFVSICAKPLLREVKELLSPQFEKQSIEINCDAQEDAMFQGDPQQLKQVLINLVKNAAESIGHDGSITLRSRKEKMHMQGKRVKVILIEVEDSGPGIPDDIRERLFNPFFSTKETGTGLGLAISARIIEKHSGILNFESESGQGTTFRIALPVQRA